jgi:poly(ADP-ribose) glycohydrolase ARH3
VDRGGGWLVHVRRAGKRADPPGAAALDDRFRGALLGAVVGDALGAPLEGHRGPVPTTRLAYLDEAGGALPHTDDTAMTFALAESLLRCDGLDEDHLAATFAAEHRRRPDRGYGPGTAHLLARLAAGGDWRQLAPAQFGGQGSLGNRAAMRVAPVALYAAGDLRRVLELARRSARVTHAHPEGVDGAAVQAAAVATALALPGTLPIDREAFLVAVRSAASSRRLRSRLDLAGELAAAGSPAELAARLGTRATAAESVPAAICAFLRHPDSFADAVRFAISLGGDVDTIASMTGAIAGARNGASAIPRHWVGPDRGGRPGDLPRPFAAPPSWRPRAARPLVDSAPRRWGSPRRRPSATIAPRADGS